MDFYIHQIGNVYDKYTYERLVCILNSKMIASRDFLEANGMKIVKKNPPFKLYISSGNEMFYYDVHIHKDRVSLSDPKNKYVKKAIEIKDHQIITCFDYDYIAFAISRDIPIISGKKIEGIALGEVQVQDKIDSIYIVGLILPFSKDDMLNSKVAMIVDMLSEICIKNDMPLDIYNYEGELLKTKEDNRFKK